MFRGFKKNLEFLLLGALVIQSNALAASRHHVISFGKWTTVQGPLEPDTDTSNGKPSTLKIRPLLVDAQVKEFTLGLAHDVTDRLFVVRRALRINDSLPQESSSPPHWQWQRGGWLLVDRFTAHITAINLTDFDAGYSNASWYRDYIAYCGLSDDGKKVYALVSQISRRKPILKKLLDGANVSGEQKDKPGEPGGCPAPTWQRNPSRVTFEAGGIPKQVFAIRGRAADLVVPEEEEEEASK
jgi:hypothetical protein